MWKYKKNWKKIIKIIVTILAVVIGFQSCSSMLNNTNNHKQTAADSREKDRKAEKKKVPPKKEEKEKKEQPKKKEETKKKETSEKEKKSAQANKSSTRKKPLFIDDLSDHLTFKNPYAKEVVIREGVTKEEVIAYEEIMSRLNADDRPEDEILSEIAPSYGMTLEDMHAFINRVMVPAINIYKDNAPSNSEIISMVKKSMEAITNPEIKFSPFESDWYVDGTTQYIAKTSKFNFNNQDHELIVKIKFDTFFQEYAIFQIKVDGKNIDFQ